MKRILFPVMILVSFLLGVASLFGAYDIEVYALKQDHATQMIKRELMKHLSTDSRFRVTDETTDLEFQEMVLADTTYLIPDMEFDDFPFLVSIDTRSMGDSKQLLVSTTMFIEGVIIDSEIYSTSLESANQIVGMIMSQILEKKPLLEKLFDRVNEGYAIDLKADIETFLALSIQFYKTPVSQGGAGANTSNVSRKTLAEFLGFYDDNFSLINEGYSTYVITQATNGIVKIKGTSHISDENGNFPTIEGTINLTNMSVTYSE